MVKLPSVQLVMHACTNNRTGNQIFFYKNRQLDLTRRKQAIVELEPVCIWQSQTARAPSIQAPRHVSITRTKRRTNPGSTRESEANQIRGLKFSRCHIRYFGYYLEKLNMSLIRFSPRLVGSLIRRRPIWGSTVAPDFGLYCRFSFLFDNNYLNID